MSDSANITLERVTFQYAGGNGDAIKNVSLDIFPGEFVVLAGRSGCGKTTVSRVVNGLVPGFYEGQLDGTVQISGKDTHGLDIGEIGKTVGSVFQDPRSQFFMTDTTSEVAFGCTHAGLPRDVILERIDDAFRRMEIEHLRDRSVFSLSSGQMQMVAIASCYALGPSVYVFDEPSANLDMKAMAALRRVLLELKREGKTVIVLEHRLFYLSGLFDRMVIVENGTVDSVYSATEALALNDCELAHRGLRCLTLDAVRFARTAQDDSNTAQLKTTTFEVKDLRFSYDSKRATRDPEAQARSFSGLGPLSLSAQSGEVVGIIGENGTGKTTLSRLCCGLEKEASGTISFDGKPLSRRERLGRIRLVMQDPDYQLFGDSVLGELSIGGLRDPGTCDKALEELGLWEMRGAHPATLSRGQKQRLTIACALVDEAAVYFFDEPTSGLDRENMERTASAIRSLAHAGSIVFTISHDFEFLMSACNRILRLENGLIADDFELTELTREKLIDSLWKGDSQWDEPAHS